MQPTSKLILGTVQFGINYGINNRNGIPSDAELKNILDVAFANGVRTLDTAKAYGNALERIGYYHKHSPNKFEVISKVSGGNWKSLESDLNKALLDANIPNLNAILFHNYQEYRKTPQSIDILQGLKNQGMVNAVGVSIYTNEEFAYCIEDKAIDLIQLPFNLLDNMNQRGALLRRAKEAGKIIHTRSVFLQGIFFKDPLSLSEHLRPLTEPVRKIRDLSSSSGLSVTSLALNYVIHNPLIDGVVIGVDTAQQLKNNFNSIDANVSCDVYEQLDRIEISDARYLNPGNWVV